MVIRLSRFDNIYNIKSLLQHWEENIKVFFFPGRTNCNQLFSQTSPKLTELQSTFHPSHPQPNIINTSFCAVVGLLLTKLNHYFNDSTGTNKCFGDTDTAPFGTSYSFHSVFNKDCNLVILFSYLV